MGVRFPSIASTTFVGPLPASGAETVILTSPPLTLPLDFSQVIILWGCSILAGTGTTQFLFQLRRGTTAAGALLNPQSWGVQITAGNPDSCSGVYVDTPGAVTGQQYSLTAIQTGATAAGTFRDGSIVAFAL